MDTLQLSNDAIEDIIPLGNKMIRIHLNLLQLSIRPKTAYKLIGLGFGLGPGFYFDTSQIQ